jgi:hypothetical protein
MYENLQDQHVRLLEEKEIEKAAALKARIMQEKVSRDKQLVDEKQKRRHEQKQQHGQEVALVKRLQEEMDAERRLQQEKRRQEKEYLQKMLVENEKHKAKALAERERERLEDVRDVKAGLECGMTLDGFQDIKVGDVLEFVQIELVKRTLGGD